MKSFFGVYSAPGAMGVDCTVLLFDKKINCLIIPNLFKEDNEKFVISYITRTINKNSNFRYTSHKFKEIFEKIKETELPEELESINNFSIFIIL